jgi:hypothetical protein
MPAPDWENLDDFLDVDEFATAAEIEFQDTELADRAIVGIFDEPYMNAELGEYSMDTVQPRFLCKADAVIGVHRGDVLVIGSDRWDIVTDPQPDGTGMATLALAPQPPGA